MRQKTEYAACPPPYTVERYGLHSAKISFAENAEEITDGENSRWQADIYELITAYTDDLEERIESGYAAWIEHAKDLDYEVAAEVIRARRDALLRESDRDMLFDRMGLEIPSGTTFTAWLTFLRGLGTALVGAAATYRQALRDIPEQEGFPYEISWPQMPNE